MKLPIQKAERRREPMASEEEMWPMPRMLMEKFFPENWIKPWINWERDMYRAMEWWTPKVNIVESDKEFAIMADVPGVKPEDIKVEIAGENLILSGKREEEKEEKGKMWHRMERRSGSFRREFELPKSVDLGKAEAVVEDGILTVKIQKKPEMQNRMIEVKTKEREQQGGQEQQGQG